MGRALLAAVAASAWLGGCTVGPAYRPPASHAPTQWWGGSSGNDVTYGGTVNATWWSAFDDPELSSLVDRLARQNLDLREAAERIRQSRAQTGIAASQGLPSLDANDQYTRVRLNPKILGALVVPQPTAPVAFDLFQDDLSAAWEIDLFGRVRRAVEASRADTAAMIEARHATALMAISSLAQDYMQLRGVQTMRLIDQRNLDDAERNASLVRNQFNNGVGTTLDIANAEAQQSTIAASLPPLRADEVRLIDAIGALLAEPPRALEAELDRPAAQPPVPPSVPIGLPSELARRRPDVRRAEALLHAATAQTGVAVANFYPDVRLSGELGTQALQFPQAFNLFSGFYLVGPTIDLPIFEGGRLRATLRLRRSQQREAALNYRNTVLQAWQDIDTALSAYTEAKRRRDDIADAVRHDRVALVAARQRYRDGAVDFLNVLAAQSALLQNQSALASSQTQIETDLVDLYRALGGGWQIADQSDLSQSGRGLPGG